ncbi:MAG: TfoX/Sxy family protein [Burkholderiaceae bacterium]
MAFDENLAAQVRRLLQAESARMTERRMFGGLAFMRNGNMLCAVGADHLMLRVGPEAYAHALRLPHASEMRFTGRTMRGYVTVYRAGYDTPAKLQTWIEMGLAFVRTLAPK